MLEIKEMSCGYGKQEIVHSFSLNVDEGEKLCIMGPNGCGKTTLLRAIGGIISYMGSIRLNGQEISEIPRKKLCRTIAMLSQISSMSFGYTVYDTVLMGRYSSSDSLFRTGKADADIVMDYICRLGLESVRNKPITELSGGQLQRTMLARTFAQQPKLLILDEPTNHLDISSQMSLVSLINDWTDEDKSRSVIGVIHEINLIPALFRNVCLMKNGNLVAYGCTSDILRGGCLCDVYNTNVSGFMKKTSEFWSDNV